MYWDKNFANCASYRPWIQEVVGGASKSLVCAMHTICACAHDRARKFNVSKFLRCKKSRKFFRQLHALA